LEMLCKKFNHLWLEIKIGIENTPGNCGVSVFNFRNLLEMIMNGVYCCYVSLEVSYHEAITPCYWICSSKNRIPGAAGFIDQV
jgi:hypothetical protein